ncbi:hypothetical protein R84B8_01636 [Treponema sp. R8-4-B8]
MKKTALLILPVIFLFTTCALEIANVIGPGGGYVYYDKGNYKDGWRYKECSPFDIGELKDTSPESLTSAVRLCVDQSDDWYAYAWEIPDEANMKKMLECFSYGLTRFSEDYYYLAINGKYIKTIPQGGPVLYAGGEPVLYVGGEPVLKPDGTPDLNGDGTPKLHKKGDPVLYAGGEAVLYAGGEPALDADGNQITNAEGKPVFRAKGEPVLYTGKEAVLDGDGKLVLDGSGNPTYHTQGEPVLRAPGEPVLHAKDDPVLDSNGKPVLHTEEYPVLDANGYPVLDEDNIDKWEVVILHKSFASKANGGVEKVDVVPDGFTIRVRPIRKF